MLQVFRQQLFNKRVWSSDFQRCCIKQPPPQPSTTLPTRISWCLQGRLVLFLKFGTEANEVVHRTNLPGACGNRAVVSLSVNGVEASDYILICQTCHFILCSSADFLPCQCGVIKRAYNHVAGCKTRKGNSRKDPVWLFRLEVPHISERDLTNTNKTIEKKGFNTMCCTIYSELEYGLRVSTLLVMFQRKSNLVRKCKTDCISVKIVN